MGIPAVIRVSKALGAHLAGSGGTDKSVCTYHPQLLHRLLLAEGEPGDQVTNSEIPWF
jgi:hypothetical protein